MKESRVKVSIGVFETRIISTSLNKIEVILKEALLTTGKQKIHLTVNNNSFESKEYFIIEGPQITGFSPSSGIIGETEITIKGNNFQKSENIVKFGGYIVTIISENENEIIVKLPSKMSAGNMIIEIKANNKLCYSDKLFEAKS